VADLLIGLALGLPCLVLASLVIGAPVIAWRVRRLRREEGAQPRRRAIVPAVLNGLATGVVLGAAGFLWGAGVGDESAGAIASALGAFGCLGGVGVGTAVNWWAIVCLTGRGKGAAPALVK
jgi:hypothetical protein